MQWSLLLKCASGIFAYKGFLQSIRRAPAILSSDNRLYVIANSVTIILGSGFINTYFRQFVCFHGFNSISDLCCTIVKTFVFCVAVFIVSVRSQLDDMISLLF